MCIIAGGCVQTSEVQYADSLLLHYHYLDVIMDMLGDQKMRMIINDYYDSTGEQDLVRKAVSESWVKEQQIYSDERDGSGVWTNTHFRCH